MTTCFPASPPPILILHHSSLPSLRWPGLSCSVSHSSVKIHSHLSSEVTKVKKTLKVTHPFFPPSSKLMPMGECSHQGSSLTYTGVCASSSLRMGVPGVTSEMPDDGWTLWDLIVYALGHATLCRGKSLGLCRTLFRDCPGSLYGIRKLVFLIFHLPIKRRLPWFCTLLTSALYYLGLLASSQ